jgi:hypothetical protein
MFSVPAIVFSNVISTDFIVRGGRVQFNPGQKFGPIRATGCGRFSLFHPAASEQLSYSL